MKPRFSPIVLALCPLVFNQCAAFAYDDNAQQQIQQIQNQLNQQFPQHSQSSQNFRPSGMPINQGMPQQFTQSMDAQQQIQQINQQLQQMAQPQPFQQPQQLQKMAQPQQFQQQPVQLNRPVQPVQQMQQQMSQPQMMPAQSSQQTQNNGFAPSSSQALNLPVLNSSIAGYASVSDVVPNPVGVTSGVDILDESLKFHSQANGQPVARPAAAMTNQNFHAGVVAQGVCNHATASGGNAQTCCQHAQGNATATNSPGGTGLNTPLNSRAIGAIGAAALVGTFLGNGGVGGMIKSVGWDNSRHTRGMSIGGY